MNIPIERDAQDIISNCKRPCFIGINYKERSRWFQYSTKVVRTSYGIDKEKTNDDSRGIIKKDTRKLVLRIDVCSTKFVGSLLSYFPHLFVSLVYSFPFALFCFCLRPVPGKGFHLTEKLSTIKPGAILVGESCL